MNLDLKCITDCVVAISGPDEIHALTETSVFEVLRAVELVFFVRVDGEEVAIG